MTAQNPSHRKWPKLTWIGIVALLIFLVFQFVLGAGVRVLIMQKLGLDVSVDYPAVDARLGQTVMVSPWQDQTVRMVDGNGVMMAIEIPAGAVSESTEISLVALESNVDSGVPSSGVMITPVDIEFQKPVVVSFNYRFTTDIVDVASRRAQVYRIEDRNLRPVLVMQAIQTETALSAIVNQGGVYVWDLSGSGGSYWASKAMDSSDLRDTEVLAAAMTYVNRDKKWESKYDSKVEKVVEEILSEDEPSLHMLYAAILIDEYREKLSWIPTAFASGNFDDYLLFRCNVEGSSYADLVAAMVISAHMGNDSLSEICRVKAEEKITSEAEALLNNPNSTIGELVEVAQQMDLIGAGDTEQGSVLRDVINEEVDKAIEKAVEEANKEAGNEYEDDPDNDNARDFGEAVDRDMSTTLLPELLGVGLAKFVGIESWDEQGFKNFAIKMEKQLGGLTQFGAGMCELFKEPDFGGGIPPELQEECEYLQSGDAQEDVGTWKSDVDEFAEGIGDIQQGNEPNSNWNEQQEYNIDLDDYERQFDINGDGELSDDEYDTMMSGYDDGPEITDDMTDEEWGQAWDEWDASH